MMKNTAFDSKYGFLWLGWAMFCFSCFALPNPADLDGDGYVNMFDLYRLAEQWLAQDCASWNWCDGADIDRSGRVDLGDFSYLAQSWSAELPVWSDEFSGESLDANKWTVYNKADGADCWYTPGNVEVSDGILKIYSCEELYKGRSWTGGYIDTAGKYNPQYKYLVARLRHSFANSYIWATWWTVGWDGALIWPPEFDICEFQGGAGSRNPGQWYHWNNEGKDTWLGCAAEIDESQWHTYGVYWNAAAAPVFYVDGVLSCAPAGPVSGALYPMKLKLTSSPSSQTRVPGCPLAVFEVDYVRVYDNPPPLPPSPPGVVSQFKTATASSVQSGNEAAYANDGSLSTRWAAADGTYPQWWKVDLGANCRLSGSDINWYNSSTRAYKYRIEVSTDDIHYTTISDRTENTTYGDTSDIFTVSARFVRVTITGCTSGSAYASIYEMRVYGN
ncbi:MAG TPA: discoidin domain-containing protein [Anaerohalosphaeraceae bacterium]|nr:discoidin domain-containing protein [Anaerohalosphaeraceae bacterium]